MLDSSLVALLALFAGAAAVGLLWLRDRQSLVRDAARLEAERDAAERSVDDQREALAASHVQLRDAFEALSRSALRENRQDFLQDAGQLLQPFRETLTRVQTQLAEVDKAREGS